MKFIAYLACASLLVVAAYVGWFVVASDYSEKVVWGTYRLVQGDVRSTLVLQPDHSFVQEVSGPSGIRHPKGTWRRVGEGGVTFSKEFLTMPGEERSSDGAAVADMHKLLGILVRLQLRPYEVVWYGRGAPSNTDEIAGAYSYREGTYSGNLIMNPDHTFNQTVAGESGTANTRGTWSLTPNGGIAFSKEFLKLSGQQLERGETATAIKPEGGFLKSK